MSVELIADGVIELIKKNIIAKTDLLHDANVGSSVINVKNAYRFKKDEEISIIDWGYNDSSHPHYQIFEYAKIKEVNDTRTITLYDDLNDSWLVSDNAFIQKTIGHSPLYEDNVFYGDREVIPVNDIAITVEPASLSNDWIYIQGGLSEEYRLRLMIYGKAITVEEGRRILDRYSWSVYSLLNRNIHINLNDFFTPLLKDYEIGDTEIVIEDTPENRDKFLPSVGNIRDYLVQDNNGISCWARVKNVVYDNDLIYLEISTMNKNFLLTEFATIRKMGRYVYDSRADSINYGQVSKGSAFLRASEINWFGKKVNEHIFPQTSDNIEDFEEKTPYNESSSSGN